MITVANKHTRAMSTLYFSHVFGLFDLDANHPIMKALKYEGIETILDIFEELESNVDNYQYEDEKGIPTYLSKGERRLLKSIFKWMFWLNRRFPNLNYGQLDLNDYDEYREKLNQQPVPSNLIPNTFPSNISSVAPSMPTFSSINNVKWDIKQYPIFNGDYSAWPKFKRGVISIAITHGLDEIFDEKYQVPNPGEPTYQLYQEKNKFVYSIWVSRINSGLAYTVIREFEDEKDGRAVYLKLL